MVVLHTTSEVYEGSTGEYVPFAVQLVTLCAQKTLDVGVGSTDDHVLFSAQLVTLLSHSRFDEVVGAIDSKLTPKTHLLTLAHLRSVLTVGAMVWYDTSRVQCDTFLHTVVDVAVAGVPR